MNTGDIGTLTRQPQPSSYESLLPHTTLKPFHLLARWGFEVLFLLRTIQQIEEKETVFAQGQ